MVIVVVLQMVGEKLSLVHYSTKATYRMKIPNSTCPPGNETIRPSIGDYRKKSIRYIATTVEDALTMMLPRWLKFITMLMIVIMTTIPMAHTNPNTFSMKKVHKQMGANSSIKHFFKPTADTTYKQRHSKTPQTPTGTTQTANSISQSNEQARLTNTNMSTPNQHQKQHNKEMDDSSATAEMVTNKTVATTQGKMTNNTKQKPMFNLWKTAGPGTKENSSANPTVYPTPKDYAFQSRCCLHWWHTGDQKNSKTYILHLPY